MICLICRARQLETDVEKLNGVCESCMEDLGVENFNDCTGIK